MARAIARNDISSKARPVLDFHWISAGVLADVDPTGSLSFIVYDISTGTAVQTFPTPSGSHAVDLTTDRISLGRYAAAWTVGNTEPLGRHRIVWSITPTAGDPVQQFEEEFDVLATGTRWRAPMYALISDLRAEGFTTTVLSDARAVVLIHRASQLIERWTHRWFDPRPLTMTTTGEPSSMLRVDAPIVALASASREGITYSASDLRVFNRHISQGLLNPDDRDDPHVELANVFSSGWPRWWFTERWSSSALGLELSGVFGYTEPSPLWPAGVTPDLIRDATIMLVARELPLLSDTQSQIDSVLASTVTEVRTRDQSIKYGSSNSSSNAATSGGEFTGNPRIDSIIELFLAPPAVGSA